MKKTKNSPQAILCLVLTAVIWGFAFVAQKKGADALPPLTFNGTRFVLAALVLVPVAFFLERKELKEPGKLRLSLLAGLLVGTVLFIASTLQQYGVILTQSAGRSSFFTGLYNILVPLFAFVFFRKKTRLSIWLGAVLAILGVFMLSSSSMDGNKSPLGDALLLIGAVFWAFHILSVDHFVADVCPVTFSLMQSFGCGVLSLLGALLFEEPVPGAFGEALIPIVYCGVFSAGIAYTLQIFGQKNTEPAFATLILSTESVFGVVGGAIIDGERMTLLGYGGCLLIFIGILLSQFDPKSLKSGHGKDTE